MVEVFKTNVNEAFHAELLIRFIHKSFTEYNTTFDLEDRDKILRVESKCAIESNRLIKLIQGFGFEIEILSDEIPSEFSCNIGLRKTA